MISTAGQTAFSLLHDDNDANIYSLCANQLDVCFFCCSCYLFIQEMKVTESVLPFSSVHMEEASVMQGAQGMLVQNWPTVSSAAGEQESSRVRLSRVVFSVTAALFFSLGEIDNQHVASLEEL